MPQITIEIDCGKTNCDSDDSTERCQFISAGGIWCEIFGENIVGAGDEYVRCQRCLDAEVRE